MKLHEYYINNKFNPTTFDILSEEKLTRHRVKRDNLYVKKLSIPNLVWKNAKVLEVGCSSGENSLLYAEMGAKLSLVEPVVDSVKRLKKLFSHYTLTGSIKKVYVDEIENVKIGEDYDIVVAEGFINTLKKRREVLKNYSVVLSQEDC